MKLRRKKSSKRRPDAKIPATEKPVVGPPLPQEDRLIVQIRRAMDKVAPAAPLGAATSS
jgi:hypothetical protein